LLGERQYHDPISFLFFPLLSLFFSSFASFVWMNGAWIWRMCAKLCVSLLIWMNVSIKYLKPKRHKNRKNLMCFCNLALSIVRLWFLVIIHGKQKRRIKYVFWLFSEKVKNKNACKNVCFKKRYGIQHVLDFVVN
jgi:hypothetical protein